MIQTMARLELQADTYRALEQMAQARHLTPSEFITDLIREFQATENLAVLQEEYQRLTEKALMRTITQSEEKRIDAICVQMSALSRRMNKEYVKEQRDRKADELIEKSEHLLNLVHQQFMR